LNYVQHLVSFICCAEIYTIYNVYVSQPCGRRLCIFQEERVEKSQKVIMSNIMLILFLTHLRI